MGFLLVVVLLSVTSSFVHAAGPRSLVNYEFENRVPPNNTVVVSATPSGNLSASEFGTVRVVTNVIRESIDKDSKVLGKVVGLVNTLKDQSLYLTFDFVYETAILNGTIGIKGRLNDAGNGELGSPVEQVPSASLEGSAKLLSWPPQTQPTSSSKMFST